VRTLNRSAVIVAPKQPFLDWLRSVDPSNLGLTMADVRGDPSVYLFPECNFDHELMEYLKASCTEIFEQELEGWDRVEENWPEDRSFTAFHRWFEYSIHWMIFDMADEPLVVEEM
jgi:hypothetical protein